LSFNKPQRERSALGLLPFGKPMPNNPDIIILGAGAAGLSAAVDLAQAGLKVTILEARDRIGGRIFTKHDPVCDAPVELGAEFIHGRPPEIWTLLRKHRVQTREVKGEQWCLHEGKLRKCDFFSKVDQIFEKLDDRGPDQSFLEFLKRCCPNSDNDPKLQDAKTWARGYVTGFHAADPALISVHSLLRGIRADEKIDGDHPFRMKAGYQTLIEIFRRQLDQADVSIELNTRAQSVRWNQTEVKITALDEASEVFTFAAPQVLITLPLGVLQANPDDKGALRFSPGLPPAKLQALDQLAMGKVIRVSLRFRQRFWEKLRPSPGSKSKTLSRMQFLLSREDWFPTWWTALPDKWPIITGWAPFHCGERLSGRSEAFVVEKGLETLGKLLRIGRRELEDLLEASYTHDWQTDPFSRGAYSYVKVGGDSAQSVLAAPLNNHLFFAGEATDTSGHHGTVHGTIASGKRAAEQILESRPKQSRSALQGPGKKTI
jgi:monoamine oxidase